MQPEPSHVSRLSVYLQPMKPLHIPPTIVPNTPDDKRHLPRQELTCSLPHSHILRHLLKEFACVSEYVHVAVPPLLCLICKMIGKDRVMDSWEHLHARFVTEAMEVEAHLDLVLDEDFAKGGQLLGVV
jgi:hypothetical protein